MSLAIQRGAFFIAEWADFGVADDEDGKQNWIHGLVD